MATSDNNKRVDYNKNRWKWQFLILIFAISLLYSLQFIIIAISAYYNHDY